LGSLRPGAAADVTVLEARDGPVELEDTVGERVTGQVRLVPVGVVRNGVRRELRREAA
jgi:predicted amidohydrolase